MSINQELSFDFKSQSNFEIEQQNATYNEFAEQWQEKISSLQQNIHDMQKQKEDVKNALMQAQSKMRNKKFINDENKPPLQDSKLQETKTFENTPYQKNQQLSLLQDSKYQEIKTFENTTTHQKNQPLSPLQNSITHFVNETINQQESQLINIRQQPIAQFLMDIRLNELYLQNFIDLGIYDNLSLLQSLPQQNKCKYLLNKYGIDRLGYQRRILARLDEELGLFQKKGLLLNIEYCQDQIPTLEEWLKSINQIKYYPNFQLAGYDNFSYLIYQEQSQYKVTNQDLKDFFFIDNDSDRSLLMAHLVIICDKMINCDLWTVQNIKKKQQQNNFNFVQCTLPNNQCMIF